MYLIQVILALVGVLQMILVGLGGWTLFAVVNTRGRVIRLETKVFDSMAAQIKDHATRLKEMEKELKDLEVGSSGRKTGGR